MSLKQDLLGAGVNLSDMARDIPDENYPNLYEVLRKEERGMPIKPGSAQEARLHKLQEYLKGILDGTVTAVQAEDYDETDEDGRPLEVGNPDMIRKHTTRPVPSGRVLIRDPVRIKGKLCGPGSIINLTQAHGPLEAGNYQFLRALAALEEPNVPVEIELYGGYKYLTAKTSKEGWPMWNAIHRTVHPDAFRRARPSVKVSRPEEDEEDDI
jgi:hypothetical protein